MDNEFATTERPRFSLHLDAMVDSAHIDLRDEVSKRLSQKEFYGTVTLQINFRSGKYNWHRITSEFTKGAGSKT